MKFTNSPFAILDKNMSTLDYQKRNLIYEDYCRKEGISKTPREDFNLSILFNPKKFVEINAL